MLLSIEHSLYDYSYKIISTYIDTVCNGLYFLLGYTGSMGER